MPDDLRTLLPRADAAIAASSELIHDNLVWQRVTHLWTDQLYHRSSFGPKVVRIYCLSDLSTIQLDDEQSAMRSAARTATT
jgi:hypothetical protein